MNGEVLFITPCITFFVQASVAWRSRRAARQARLLRRRRNGAAGAKPGGVGGD